MVLNPTAYPDKLLELIIEYSKITRYKDNMFKKLYLFVLATKILDNTNFKNTNFSKKYGIPNKNMTKRSWRSLC